MRDQQVIDVGGAVLVDHEARIGLLEGHLANGQGVTVAVRQGVEVQLLPFDEVTVLDGVQGVQLVDLGLAIDAEGQRLDALEVDVEVAAEHAAA
ncbi:hypothetical protein D3C81_977030 [compost metagenome]